MKRIFKKISKLLVKVGNGIMFALTGKGPVAEEMADEDVLDYSGQGRGKNGK